MEEIKNQVETVVKDRGFLGTLAGILVGYVVKRYTHDTAASVGAGLVTYSLTKRV